MEMGSHVLYNCSTIVEYGGYNALPFAVPAFRQEALPRPRGGGTYVLHMLLCLHVFPFLYFAASIFVFRAEISGTIHYVKTLYFHTIITIILLLLS